MREGNDTIKLVGGLIVGGGLIYLGKRYLDRQAEQATISSKLQTIITDANASGNALKPAVKDVVKDLKTNPKNQSYSVGEYKLMADSLFNYLVNRNYNGIITMFSNMKTNEDLKLLNIYFAVKVYKQDDWNESFQIHTWNLSQFMSSELVPAIVRSKVNEILKKKNITYKIF